jgi:hypothetical protein
VAIADYAGALLAVCSTFEIDEPPLSQSVVGILAPELDDFEIPARALARVLAEIEHAS